MPAPRKTAHWWILGLLTLTVALIFGGFAWQQSELFELASTPPDEFTLKEFQTKGPGTNKHIKLTNFALSQEFVVEKNRDTWQNVWIPAFDANERMLPAKIALVVKTPYPRNVNDLADMARQPSIKGILQRKAAFGPAVRDELNKAHAGSDVSDAWVLEELRHVPNADVIRWSYILGIAIAVLGIAFIGIWLAKWLTSRPKPSDDVMPESAFDDDPTKRGRVVAEYGTGSGLHYFVLIASPIFGFGFLCTWLFTLYAGYKVRDQANAGLIVAMILSTLFLGGLGIFFLYGFVTSILAMRWKLVIYENGLLLCKRRSTRWLPWSTVRAYHEMIVLLDGISTGHQFWMRLKTGKKFRVDAVFKDVSGAIAKIKQQLTPVLTREITTRIREGLPVDFDHVLMRREGLEDSEGTITPWREVELVAIEQRPTSHNVTVKVIDRKKPLVDVPVSNFPNAEIFITLAQSAVRSQQGKR